MDTTLSSIDTANSSGMNTLSSNNSSSCNSSSSSNSNTNTTIDTTDGLPFCFVRVSLMNFFIFFIISFTNN